MRSRSAAISCQQDFLAYTRVKILQYVTVADSRAFLVLVTSPSS